VGKIAKKSGKNAKKSEGVRFCSLSKIHSCVTALSAILPTGNYVYQGRQAYKMTTYKIEKNNNKKTRRYCNKQTTGV